MLFLFKDRFDAGGVLAQKLLKYAHQPDVLVLGLPRGGVAVAFEVARALDAPLDVFVVRKLGVPGHEELALGAIATGGILVLNHDLVRSLGISRAVIDEIARREKAELGRREQAYRGDQPPPDLHRRTVIVVDDGLATGASMRAAVAAVRLQEPAWLVSAVPTAAPQTCEELGHQVDEMVCATTPEPFLGVGRWYENFEQMTDDEVRELLERSRQRQPAGT